MQATGSSISSKQSDLSVNCFSTLQLFIFLEKMHKLNSCSKMVMESCRRMRVFLLFRGACFWNSFSLHLTKNPEDIVSDNDNLKSEEDTTHSSNAPGKTTPSKLPTKFLGGELWEQKSNKYLSQVFSWINLTSQTNTLSKTKLPAIEHLQSKVVLVHLQRYLFTP